MKPPMADRWGPKFQRITGATPRAARTVTTEVDSFRKSARSNTRRVRASELKSGQEDDGGEYLDGRRRPMRLMPAKQRPGNANVSGLNLGPRRGGECQTRVSLQSWCRRGKRSSIAVADTQPRGIIVRITRLGICRRLAAALAGAHRAAAALGRRRRVGCRCGNHRGRHAGCHDCKDDCQTNHCSIIAFRAGRPTGLAISQCPILCLSGHGMAGHRVPQACHRQTRPHREV